MSEKIQPVFMRQKHWFGKQGFFFIAKCSLHDHWSQDLPKVAQAFCPAPKNSSAVALQMSLIPSPLPNCPNQPGLYLGKVGIPWLVWRHVDWPSERAGPLKTRCGIFQWKTKNYRDLEFAREVETAEEYDGHVYTQHIALGTNSR